MDKILQGLLQDILENPSDDTPRLIFADVLEEQNFPEHANFIRAQIELAKLPQCYATTVDNGGGDPRGWPCQCRWHTLKKQERQLFEASKLRLTTMEEKRCGIQWNADAIVEVLNVYQPETGWVLYWKRGFLSTVLITWELWKEHGPRLASQHPIQVVRLFDKDPVSSYPNEGGDWFDEQVLGADWNDMRDVLPHELWVHLTKGIRKGSFRYYPTNNQEPWDDLSEACLKWAKEQT